MAAALIPHFPTSSSLSSPRRLLHHRRDRARPKLVRYVMQPFSPRHRFSVCCASFTRPRASGRKVLSNAELCIEIKELLSASGLPEDHLPSIKELALLGRNDLANIVRRRGYKLVRELLTDSVQLDADACDVRESSAVKQAELVGSGKAEQSQGQSMKAEILADLSGEVPAEEHIPVPVSPYVDPYVTFGSNKSSSQEHSANLHSEENKSHFDDEGLINDRISLPRVAIAEESSSGLDATEEPNSSKGDPGQEKAWNNLPSEIESSSNFMGQLEESDFNIFSPTGASYGKEYHNNSEPPNTSTSKENALMSLKDGYPDPADYNVSEIYDEIGEEEFDGLGSAELSDSENGTKNRRETPAVVQPVHEYGSTAASITLQESTSYTGSSPDQLDYPLGDNHSANEELSNAYVGNTVDTETRKVANQVEINRLKYMLHQKELELSRLKEEIEKEKYALNLLQAKAEHEIYKARKLISEKDAELQAAEESLSELKEVEIQYCGDGDIVEVAGSFNGWHQRIKMDPQPLARSMTGPESRNSRLWSTMLWLYPGVYEIKFVVDGQWKVDPDKESTSKGSISNNILRVDR